MGATVFDVANYYLANSDNITPKKLQKMVYYAYAWHLTLSNDDIHHLTNRLFDNHFEAWVHGAVDPSLYSAYKEYGTECIPQYIGMVYSFSPDDRNVLDQVNEVYGRYDGNDLESINHQENPWIDARKGLGKWEPSHNKITDESIYSYYIQRVA